MTSTQKSQVSDLFSHLRRYSRELFSLDTRPLVDQTFSFPWSALSTELKKTFGCDISISPGEFGWKAKDDLFKGIAAPFFPIAIAIPGVTGQMILLLSNTDIERLMIHTLHVDIAALSQQDPSFFDQFSLFFSAELVSCALGIPMLKALSPRLTPRLETESAGCVCQDIDISLQGEKGLARLIITPEFLEGWRTFRMGTDESSPSPSSLRGVDITVSVEAGRTFLTPEEISELHNGDFLLLDYPFYIPGSPKARVFLTFNSHPLFRAKVEEGKIKILEMPLQHEAFLFLGGHSMSTKGLAPHNNADESDSLLSENDPHTQPVFSKPGPLNPSGDHSQDPIGENPFEGEEEPEEELDMPPLSEKEARQATGVSPNLSKEPLDFRKIPLTVVVELTELSMPIEEITSLQPGNLLDLDIRPENGVMLVVNGKVFGQGELVLIGDNVGVRIKEIAFDSSVS